MICWTSARASATSACAAVAPSAVALLAPLAVGVMRAQLGGLIHALAQQLRSLAARVLDDTRGVVGFACLGGGLQRGVGVPR